MDHHSSSLAKNQWRRASACAGAVLLLGSFLRAEEECPVEVKLLLSPASIQTVIASLGLEKETSARVYFFDTEELDLLKQGVIVRVRQGANNDLTVKVRAPEGNQQVETAQLRGQLPCEIDRTGAGENTTYSVGHKYRPLQVPEMGADIFRVLSPPQKRLLQEARVSLDWSRVRRLAKINATQWETRSQAPFRKVALELWKWPMGEILELSAKVGLDPGRSKSAELQRLVTNKGLPLSASQGTKTRTVLETLTHRDSTQQ
jgi:hypothetical protein